MAAAYISLPTLGLRARLPTHSGSYVARADMLSILRSSIVLSLGERT